MNQEEVDLFEDEVILAGSVALPGAMELVSQVSDASLIFFWYRDFLNASFVLILRVPQNGLLLLQVSCRQLFQLIT